MRQLLIATVLMPVVILVTAEVGRAVAHRRRERRAGPGGTQDVAAVGSIVAIAAFPFALAALVALARGADE